MPSQRCASGSISWGHNMPKAREREYRALSALSTKVLDESLGIAEAIVNVLGIVDLGDDVILSGAAAKSISERGRKVQVLNSHNAYGIQNIVGICLEIREIGRDELPAEILAKHPEATGGIWTKTQYLMNTPEGRGAF